MNNNFSDTITASGNVAVTGTFATPGNSTIVMVGAGTTIDTGTQIGNLQVNTGATTVTVASRPCL